MRLSRPFGQFPARRYPAARDGRREIGDDQTPTWSPARAAWAPRGRAAAVTPLHATKSFLVIATFLDAFGSPTCYITALDRQLMHARATPHAHGYCRGESPSEGLASPFEGVQRTFARGHQSS